MKTLTRIYLPLFFSCFPMLYSPYLVFAGEITKSEFIGIGVTLDWDNEDDQGLKIVSVMEGYPAAQSGIRQDDIIVAVDNQWFFQWDANTNKDKIENAVNLIKGKEGTDVILHIRKANSNEIVTRTVCRERINLSFQRRMLSETTGYIQPIEFYHGIDQDGKDDVSYLRKQGMKQLIVDLRSNKGGNFNEAVAFTSLFLRERDLIAYTSGSGLDEHFYNDERREIHEPLVILIDNMTAGASEMVAAALQDHNRAKIVGSKSAGKGILNTETRFSGITISYDDDIEARAIAMWKGNQPVATPTLQVTSLKVNESYFYSPAGNQIHNVGIVPDITVDSSFSSGDINNDWQLKKALEHLEN